MFRNVALSVVLTLSMATAAIAGEATTASKAVVHFTGIKLFVADHDRSVKFYSLLGFKNAPRVPETQNANQIRLSLTGNPEHTNIMLVKQPADQLNPARLGFGIVVMDIANAAVLHKQLTDAGYKPENLMVGITAAKLDIFYVTDPDGYRLELVQRTKP
jgi:catechol 2,3-dioxygenase-like lactoylglutathione lyase family enzyme